MKNATYATDNARPYLRNHGRINLAEAQGGKRTTLAITLSNSANLPASVP